MFECAPHVAHTLKRSNPRIPTIRVSGCGGAGQLDIDAERFTFTERHRRWTTLPSLNGTRKIDGTDYTCSLSL